MSRPSAVARNPVTAMFCTACAHPLRPTDRRCDHCGTSLEPPERFAERTTPDRHVRLWTVATLPVVVLLLVLLGGAGREIRHRQQLDRQYDRGAAALARGDLLAAEDAFTRAGDARDADRQLASVQDLLRPYRDAVVDAQATIDEGRYDDAIALLVPVARDIPADDDAYRLLEEARAQRSAALEREASEAERSEDWLRAERALTELVKERPDDPQLVGRLAALRRDHAPILYVWQGGIYTTDVDQSSQRAIVENYEAAWPMWSPDRTKVAFSTLPAGRHSLAGSLYVVNVDGTGLRLLATSFLPVTWPVWSPDGTKIAFTDPSNFDPDTGSGHINISVVDVATGRLTDVTQDRYDFATSPTWSPDSTRLAYVDRIIVAMGNGFDFTNGDVHVVDLATGATKNVTGYNVENERQVSWSPVDDRLLVYTDPGDWSSEESGGILIWDLATSERIDIPTDVRSPERAFWSPDGSRIAWVEGNDVVKFWSESGVEWVRLATDIDNDLSWAPDGHALLAPGSTLVDPSYVIAVDARFGDRRQIKLSFDVTNGGAGVPIWSPFTAPAPPLDVGGTAFDPGATSSGRPAANSA